MNHILINTDRDTEIHPLTNAFLKQNYFLGLITPFSDNDLPGFCLSVVIFAPAYSNLKDM